MKKTSLFMTVFLIACMLLISCGSSNEQAAPEESASAVVESTEEPAEQEPEPVATTEKSVDAIADALGLTDKGEVYFSMIGATDGAEFNGGAVELYIFDESSDEYKATIEGGAMITATAYKDGVVLAFPEGTEPDQAIIDAFNNLVFE